MKCIYCFQNKTEVKNSRAIKGGVLTWRRRRCLSCGKIFTTKESALSDNLFVVKRSGVRERFLYEKLFVSLFTVINSRKNRDNGDDAKLAKKLAWHIIKSVVSASARSKNVPSSTLITLSYLQLKKIGSHYANQYINYSDYRRAAAYRAGLIKPHY